ncbi:MAG: TetR/AcrR family transcriptional regulator [Ilumatobacteraceae bacterium]
MVRLSRTRPWHREKRPSFSFCLTDHECGSIVLTMLVAPKRDRRTERREATKAEILDAAWAQVRTDGLSALSLRDVARAVGMQPPSLYGYFDSKNAIYDAMYAQGARAFVEAEPLDVPDDPVEGLKAVVHYFVEFCAADAARYLLLFQRTIPGFEPSVESFAISKLSIERLGERIAACGITDPAAVDLFTAIGTGLTDQQISNDPGGDRWIRLIDDAVEMFYSHMTNKGEQPSTRRRQK